MDPMMHMPLLPGWLRAVFAVVLCAVLAVHVWHARTMRGQRRWWHLGHSFMAAGMVAMFALPMMTLPALQGACAALFAVLAVVSAGTATLLRRSEGVLNPLWPASGLDMLAMTYMLLPHGYRPGVVTVLFVLYLAVQTVAWALGLWDRSPAFRNPEPAVLDLPPDRGSATAVAGGVAVGLTAHSTPAVRTSLAVMAASMAYMLVAM